MIKSVFSDDLDGEIIQRRDLSNPEPHVKHTYRLVNRRKQAGSITSEGCWGSS